MKTPKFEARMPRVVLMLVLALATVSIPGVVAGEGVMSRVDGPSD
jgi:hypothetical protein